MSFVAPIAGSFAGTAKAENWCLAASPMRPPRRSPAPRRPGSPQGCRTGHVQCVAPVRI